MHADRVTHLLQAIAIAPRVAMTAAARTFVPVDALSGLMRLGWLPLFSTSIEQP